MKAVVLGALASPVSAGCSSSDQVYTCTGDDIYPYEKQVDEGSDAYTFSFSGLGETATSGSKTFVISVYSTGEEGNSDGDDGKEGAPINLTFGGGAYGISGSSGGLSLRTTGGKGHDGKNRSGISVSGGHGGDGGLAGKLSFNWDSGTIAANEYGLIIQSVGGLGGDGGEGHADSGNGHGGDGGVGGVGGDLDIALGADDAVTIASGPLLFGSAGGAGGKGGKGAADVGDGKGAPGGAGGAGGSVSLEISNDVTITANPLENYGALSVFSAGGQGGHGGNASGDLGESSASHGGIGGAGGAVAISMKSDTDALDITTDSETNHAIFAQSLGGAGGDGGDGETDVGSKASGGNGGQGGDGGTVDITVETATAGLKTDGDQSQGILARSYGGSGGDGGNGVGGLADGSGGAGAGPGNGSEVKVTFVGDITTGGSESNGIMAQSVGGFSGDAGSSSGFIAYGSGAQSGGAGAGVDVIVGVGSSIATAGEASSGVLAQSVGGGGGRGSGGDGLVSLGGSGSAGGDGGVVSASVDGVISTGGDSAVAIEASSVGGSGGSAGASGGVVSLGGSGGTGGDGKAVTVTNGATLTTSGDQADGIFAQSVGGGGGSAHSTSGMDAIGGSGGSGGTSALAEIISTGADVSTKGDDADAIFVQSVGGGGGSGSNAVAAGAQVTVAIGGTGGSGGAGGGATYSDAGAEAYAISTQGQRARGIVAQSVGGGGGDGGYAVAASAGALFDVSLGMSGGGSNGGTGGAVNVETLATITTAGDHSVGIQASSTGGGGGSSGTTISSANSAGVGVSQSLGGSGGSGGAGGAVLLYSSGVVSTAGASATAVLAQSVGGGGGYSGATIDANGLTGMSVSTSIGGDGGAGGDSDEVSATVLGDVATTGASSDGVSASSVGGSGGTAHVVIAATGASSSLSSDVAVGGDGGGGGNGAAVSADVSGDVTTTGDNSIAINAKSVGGSGGNGSLTISGSLVSAGDANISVGGTGGASGTGGNVIVSASGAVMTSGDNAYGILAKSISNSGGHGGMAVDGSGVAYGNAAVGVGGSGGDGGSSGDVDVTVDGAVNTSGDQAIAIKAMSVGGGGGSAIGTISGTVASMGEVGVSVGGEGGTGGDAGAVSVTLNDAVTTTGDNSDGIYASSQGGSGGHGGFAIEGALTGGEYSGSLNVNVGGAGGDGGQGGTVTVKNTANNLSDGDVAITVSGYEARGLFAQSVGGSGGRGGAVYSGNLTLSSTVAIDVGVDVGGGGGEGAVGGDVTVTSAGEIQTQSINGDGILAQSIGGDGGVGGGSYSVAAQTTGDSSANFDTSVGGLGGSGNHAGEVEVSTASEAIVTLGDSAYGIFAQSVGGGGGRGGNAASVLFDVTDQSSSETTYSINANVDVGGAGGAGGNGDTVQVENSAPIVTTGTASSAIYTQSIGGGGGNGGSVSGLVMSVNTTCTFSKLGYSCPNASGAKSTYTPTLELEIGGAGGSGGEGGTVIASNGNRIETDGDAAPAIFAQSIGGGGGHGGYGNLGIDAWAPPSIVQDIDEYAAESVSPFNNLKSFQTVKVVVGGAGGSAGDAGAVAIDNTGEIVTNGEASYGVQAQSIGGGGGHGGNALGGFGSITQLNVGGVGSGGGNGGKVTVTNQGSITTAGDGSMAIYAQSVGGGGGSAGDIEASLASGWDDLNIGMGVGIQLDAGSGGNGGDIEVTLEDGGGIATSGTNAHAIFAQSVGGTGGSAHLTGLFESDPAFSFNGSAGDVGKGGDITIELDAGIKIDGEGAHGIFAQSVSGTVETGDEGSAAGDIDVTVNADITTTGGNSRGMLLQSQGADGHGSINVTVAETATVETADISFETIGFMQGSGNTLTNAGSILRPDDGAVTGYVLRAEDGALQVTNSGTIEGSVLLDGDKTNSITNTGVIGLGQAFTLGPKSSLTNDGTISPGTAGTVGSTSFAGGLVQDADGIMQIDFDVTAAENDLITVTEGDAPDLAGTVLPYGLNFTAQTGDSDTLTFFDSTVGISSDSLDVDDTATVDYGLSRQSVGGADQIQLTYTVDYQGPATNENQLSFAHYIDDLVASRRAEIVAQSTSLEFVDGFVDYVNRIEGVAELRALYDDYTPGEVFMSAEAGLFAARNFADLLHSCDDADATGLQVFTRQGNCAYFGVSGGQRNVEDGDLSVGFKETYRSITGGFQVEFSPDWFLGGALSYDDFNLNSQDGDSSGEGHRLHFGVVVKREWGDTTFAASLSGGRGAIDLTRQIITPDGIQDASGSPDSKWIAANLRASHTFRLSETRYVRPWIDLGAVKVQQDAYEETGAGAYGLSLSEANATFWTLNPGLEFGTAFTSGAMDGVAKLRLGALAVLGDDRFTTNARMSGAAGTTYNFSNKTSQTMIDIGISLDAKIGNQVYLETGVNALIGNNYRDASATLRVSYAF